MFALLFHFQDVNDILKGLTKPEVFLVSLKLNPGRLACSRIKRVLRLLCTCSCDKLFDSRGHMLILVIFLFDTPTIWQKNKYIWSHFHRTIEVDNIYTNLSCTGWLLNVQIDRLITLLGFVKIKKNRSSYQFYLKGIEVKLYYAYIHLTIKYNRIHKLCIMHTISR